MPTNRYFNNSDFPFHGEQNLQDDLVREIIQIHGQDMNYIFRENVNDDEIFGETPENVFKNNASIEMMIQNVDGFEGEGDIFSKFGLEIKDTATLVVSKSRFLEEIGQSVREYGPKEGDLIYFPLTKSLFEITFVERENPFYQFGKNFIYTITVELFDYSYEDMNTGIPEVDSLEDVFNEDLTGNSNSENDEIQTESDSIKDFSEDNPFGNY